jgi:poly(3-hydroxybutyrate) depolymerase
MRYKIVTILACLFIMLASLLASAETLEKNGEFAGVNLQYRVILPNNYDASKSYPMVLHFAGGSQNWRIVVSSTESDWREIAENNGYIVISPAAPNSELFFREGARVFPEFLEYILANYPVAGGKLHVTGHSNGGLSAFHIASLYPAYFISVTGYPGLLGNNNSDQFEALSSLCIFMHVGDGDPSWRSAMNAQFLAMQGLGYEVSFTVENNQVHRLKVNENNLRERLLNELAQARMSCSEP